MAEGATVQSFQQFVSMQQKLIMEINILYSYSMEGINEGRALYLFVLIAHVQTLDHTYFQRLTMYVSIAESGPFIRNQ